MINSAKCDIGLYYNMLASIIGAIGTHVDCLQFINPKSRYRQMNGGFITKGSTTALGVYLKDNFSFEIKVRWKKPALKPWIVHECCSSSCKSIRPDRYAIRMKKNYVRNALYRMCLNPTDKFQLEMGQNINLMHLARVKPYNDKTFQISNCM